MNVSKKILTALKLSLRKSKYITAIYSSSDFYTTGISWIIFNSITQFICDLNTTIRAACLPIAGNLGDVIMALGKIYVTRAVGEAVARRSPNTTPSINTLTYMVDLILWYMEGKKPVEVYARSASKVFKKYNRDDFQWLIVTFDDGSVATLGTSWLPPHHWPAYTATMEIDLQGTGGS